MRYRDHPRTALVRPSVTLIRYAVALIIVGFIIVTTFPLAQAQEPTQPVIVRYVLDFGSAKTAICLGETVTYRVRVIARILVPGHPEADSHHVTGVSLTQSFDPSILQDVTNRMTRPPVTGLFTDVALDITYQFKAIAPGRTSIDFVGTVQIQTNLAATPNTFPLADSLQVRVVPCQIKVVTVTRFTQVLAGSNVKGIAIIYSGYLHGDAEGYYAGDADVVYLITARVERCGYANTLNIGTATLNGRLNVDDQIQLNVTFLPVKGSEAIPCTGAAIGPSMTSLGASPLKVTVPINGGVANVPQTISTLAGSVGGTANVAVFIEPIQ